MTKSRSTYTGFWHNKARRKLGKISEAMIHRERAHSTPVEMELKDLIFNLFDVKLIGT